MSKGEELFDIGAHIANIDTEDFEGCVLDRIKKRDCTNEENNLFKKDFTLEDDEDGGRWYEFCNHERSEGEKWYELDFTGKVKICYKQGYGELLDEDGNVELRCMFEEGKRNGLEERFYENGKVKSRVRYVMGLKDGLEETFYENGNTFRKGMYKLGKEEGVHVCLHENGMISSITVYTGLEEIYENFHMNGRLHLRQVSVEMLAKRSKGSKFSRRDSDFYDEDGNLVERWDISGRTFPGPLE
jgi:hypothetical protein